MGGHRREVVATQYGDSPYQAGAGINHLPGRSRPPWEIPCGQGEGADEWLANCRSLARFELSGIPAMDGGRQRGFRVGLAVFPAPPDGASHGCRPRKRTHRRGGSASRSRRPNGLSHDDMADMLYESLENARGPTTQGCERRPGSKQAQALLALEAALRQDWRAANYGGSAAAIDAWARPSRGRHGRRQNATEINAPPRRGETLSKALCRRRQWPRHPRGDCRACRSRNWKNPGQAE